MNIFIRLLFVCLIIAALQRAAQVLGLVAIITVAIALLKRPAFVLGMAMTVAITLLLLAHPWWGLACVAVLLLVAKAVPP